MAKLSRESSWLNRIIELSKPAQVMADRQSEHGSWVARKRQSAVGPGLAGHFVEALQAMDLAMPERVLRLVVGLGEDERAVALSQDGGAEELVAAPDASLGRGRMSASTTSNRRSMSDASAMSCSREADLVRLREVELLEVGAVAAAVDHQEILGFAERRQHAVPEVARVVDALAGPGQEGARAARPVLPSGQTTTTKGRGVSGMNAWLPKGWRSTIVSRSGKS